MKTNYFTSAAMAIAMFTISSAAMADNVQTTQNKQESQTAEVEAEAQPQPLRTSPPPPLCVPWLSL